MQKHLLQSDKVTETLLQIYETYPVLWDKKHVNLKNISLKNINWEKLTQELNQELKTDDDATLTVEQVTTRIKSVRDYYKKEKDKIKDSTKSGSAANDVYTPTVPWFNTADHILREVTSVRKTTSSLVSKNLYYLNNLLI